jgi:hypothetical protein
MIENRNLSVGTRLVANYKKVGYVCTVEAAEEGDGVLYVLEDGSKHKSPSAAGMRVMGGKAVNGWRFWSLDGEATATENGASEKAPRQAKQRVKKIIFKTPNQQNLKEGEVRWFCAACMKGFVGTPEQPQVCPEGHRIDDPELTSDAGEGAE